MCYHINVNIGAVLHTRKTPPKEGKIMLILKIAAIFFPIAVVFEILRHRRDKI